MANMMTARRSTARWLAGSGAAAVLLLSACGEREDERQRQGLLRTIGLTQPPPDEFLVVERRPLQMPAAYNELPAPAPGTRNLVEPTPEADVTNLLKGAGTGTNVDTSDSAGEAELLARAGANEADPTIRETVNAEDSDAAERATNRYGLATVFGRRTSDPYAEEALDPDAENARLKREGVTTPAAPPPPEEPKSNEFTLFN